MSGPLLLQFYRELRQSKMGGNAGVRSRQFQLAQSLENTIFGAGSRMPSAASENGTTRDVTTSG